MKVHVIQTGDVQIKSRHMRPRFSSRPARVLDVLFDRGWAPPLPIQFWVVEHPEGVLVIDTGESAKATEPGYQPWWHPFMRTCERRRVTRAQEADAGLRSIGLDPAGVRRLVMTHMHGDHAGGICHFRGSPILITGIEARLALAPSGQLDGYLNMHYPKWLKPEPVAFTSGAWETFESSFALTQDGTIRLIPTPGHTAGHLSVVLDLGGHLVLVAGDAAYSETALLNGVVDGVAQDWRPSAVDRAASRSL